MKHLQTLVVCLLLSVGLWIGPVGALAQGSDDACPALVESALAATDAACDETGRNQACYGHFTLEAEAQEGAEGFVFEQAGDLADVAALASLRLSPMDVEAEGWGVALLRIQADLPEALPGQNVLMLLFGDVEIVNAGGAAAPLLLEVTASAGVNIRARPSTSGAVLGSLAAGETVTADGRNEAGDWLRVQLADGGTGWVFAELVTSEGDLDALSVVGSEPRYGPMQAFYLSTGFGDAPCAEAPESGLLIQTPEGAAEVTLRVNEVMIQLGSTAFLQAGAGDEMTVNVVEGRARVTAFAVTRIVPAGARVRVPLDEHLAASGPPSEPEPYDEAALAALPVGSLDREIAIAPALTPGEIETTITETETTAGSEVVDPLANIGADDACTLAAGSAVNLRGGPGTDYPARGQLAAGQTASPDGQATGADGLVWWRLADGSWVRSDLVRTAGACGGIAVVDAPALPPDTTDTGQNADAGASGGGQIIQVQLDNFRPCEPFTIPAGATVRFNIGLGFGTEAEAAASQANDVTTIIIDGQVAPAFQTPIVLWDTAVGSLYSYWTQYLWTPPGPGVYVVSGTSIHHGTVTCTLTVE